MAAGSVAPWNCALRVSNCLFSAFTAAVLARMSWLSSPSLMGIWAARSRCAHGSTEAALCSMRCAYRSPASSSHSPAISLDLFLRSSVVSCNPVSIMRHCAWLSAIGPRCRICAATSLTIRSISASRPAIALT